MRDDESSHRIVKIISHHEDIPSLLSGFLIPTAYRERSEQCGQPVVDTQVWIARLWPQAKTLAVVALTVCLLFAVVTSTQLGVMGQNTAAAPVVFLESNEQSDPVPLHYGANGLLSQPNFFIDTVQQFQAQHLTFIAADLAEKRLVLYVEGEKALSAPIVATGATASYRTVPSGLYEIDRKEASYFSTLEDLYQPWSLLFQENFVIHGEPVGSTALNVGGIQLATEHAQELFNQTQLGTTVLVHAADYASDDFVYSQITPDTSAKQYAVVDIDNNTVLTAQGLTDAVPIASITKLMTAVVAAEAINLDETVRVSPEKYVSTLIPRLSGHWQVPVYSLLQLLLVESSNEAAEVIAARLGRSEFITLMNKKALELSLVDTTFTDPSGLDDGNVSSVADLVRLAQYIYQNHPFIFELTKNGALPNVVIENEFGDLNNFNTIEAIDTFVGGKVGETLAAGQTVISLHEVVFGDVTRTVVIVILGSTDRESDTQKLLQHVHQQFGQ